MGDGRRLYAHTRATSKHKHTCANMHIHMIMHNVNASADYAKDCFTSLSFPKCFERTTLQNRKCSDFKKHNLMPRTGATRLRHNSVHAHGLLNTLASCISGCINVSAIRRLMWIGTCTLSST